MLTDLSARRRVVSYSDGEGSKANIGVALWEIETQVVRASVGRLNDIFEIEAIAPLILLENFQDLFRVSLWLHFLDSAAALSNLVNGSSSVIQGDILIGATWSQVQRLQVFPRFDRVDSKSNPGDGLSQGWKVESLAFPGSLLQALRSERALYPTRCWRCSSGRVGARQSTASGSARWFPYPRNTWEPLLLTG